MPSYACVVYSWRIDGDHLCLSPTTDKSTIRVYVAENHYSIVESGRRPKGCIFRPYLLEVSKKAIGSRQDDLCSEHHSIKFRTLARLFLSLDGGCFIRRMIG